MARKRFRLNNTVQITFTFIFVSGIAYAFLSLVNYSFNIGEWGGFSRFVIGFIGVIYLLKILTDEL